MADSLTVEKRSWNMSRIKSKDTSIEIAVRSYLFRKGYRFRKNDRRLPGKPDVVLAKYKTVIFIHGCFWHHHSGCKIATTPKSNTAYWVAKFEHNVKRDNINKLVLEQQGWKVITLWECEIKYHFPETMLKTVDLLEQL